MSAVGTVAGHGTTSSPSPNHRCRGGDRRRACGLRQRWSGCQPDLGHHRWRRRGLADRRTGDRPTHPWPPMLPPNRRNPKHRRARGTRGHGTSTGRPSAGTRIVADDGNDWLLPLLIIAGLILIVVVVGGLLSRSKKSTPAPTAAPLATATTPSPQSPQSSLLSTSQWITDQLSLELMAAPPTDALQRWSVERSRLDNVAIGAQQQFLAGQNPNWQQLAQAMSALAASVDTSLALRAQVPPNAQLISESINVVNGHRTTSASADRRAAPHDQSLNDHQSITTSRSSRRRLRRRRHHLRRSHSNSTAPCATTRTPSRRSTARVVR